MQHIFWLRDAKIAGRTGPNNHPWDIQAFVEQGFSAIISVNDAAEVDANKIRSSGLAYAHIPMSDNAPAEPGDLEYCLKQLPKAIAFIQQHSQTGPVLVHCRLGQDRTGLVLAACLVAFENLTPQAAMDEVWKVRPNAFGATDWVNFVPEVLSLFAQQNTSF
jgi:protein-tyrosine phosphatase